MTKTPLINVVILFQDKLQVRTYYSISSKRSIETYEEALTEPLPGNPIFPVNDCVYQPTGVYCWNFLNCSLLGIAPNCYFSSDKLQSYLLNLKHYLEC